MRVRGICQNVIRWMQRPPPNHQVFPGESLVVQSFFTLINSAQFRGSGCSQSQSHIARKACCLYMETLRTTTTKKAAAHQMSTSMCLYSICIIYIALWCCR